jgi:hypothetical protein
MGGATDWIERERVDAQPTYLLKVVGGMTPEQIGDTSCKEEFDMIKCSDVLAHCGSDQIRASDVITY